MEETEPKVVEIEEDEDQREDDIEEDELDATEEMMFAPVTEDPSQLDESQICWPPRPTFPPMGDLYDKIKSFVLDHDQNELIFNPMDGEERKLVHRMAELFDLHTKSFGQKSRRHVRVYKSIEVPDRVDDPQRTNATVAAGNANPRMKELKIPMFIKTSADAIREEVLRTVGDSSEKLVKRVIREGSGETPSTGEEVYLHYEGYYAEDGGVFDSSRLREKEFTFVVGQGEVITGLDMGVMSMKAGEKAELILPPSFAFGKLGCPPRIPAGAILKYEVELFRFAQPMTEEIRTGSNSTPLSVEATLEYAVTCKCEGNTLVSSKSFRKATKSYNRGINYLSRLNSTTLTEAQEAQLCETKIPLYSNLALCHLRLNDWPRAKASCEMVLQMDSDHAKALCRLGEALIQLKDWNTAQQVLNKVYQQDETDKQVRKLLRQVVAHKKEEKEKTQKFYQNIFK